jgi:hypothetical protein
MKVPPEKLKPFSTDIAPECTKLILSLKCTGEPSEFASKLDGITEWCSIFGKVNTNLILYFKVIIFLRLKWDVGLMS